MRMKTLKVVLSVISMLCLLPLTVTGSDERTIAVNHSLYVVSSDDELRANGIEAFSFGEGELAIPQLYQADFTSILAIYKVESKSVLSSGYGVVCLSMVLAYL